MGREEILHKDMILTHIRMNGATTISELAEVLKVSRPTIYLHLKTLEKKGLIKREKDPKKKGAPVKISPVVPKIKEKEKNEMVELLKMIKEKRGLGSSEILNYPIAAELSFRGYIKDKVFITPEGEEFLKTHSSRKEVNK